MSICFDKLLTVFEERKITSYTIKKENIIGQETWRRIKTGGTIDTKTIDRLCQYLDCQPGDIMEYKRD